MRRKGRPSRSCNMEGAASPHLLRCPAHQGVSASAVAASAVPATAIPASAVPARQPTMQPGTIPPDAHRNALLAVPLLRLPRAHAAESPRMSWRVRARPTLPPRFAVQSRDSCLLLGQPAPENCATHCNQSSQPALGGSASAALPRALPSALAANRLPSPTKQRRMNGVSWLGCGSLFAINAQPAGSLHAAPLKDHGYPAALIADMLQCCDRRPQMQPCSLCLQVPACGYAATFSRGSC